MDNFYAAWEKSKKAKAGLRELLGGEEYRFTYKTSPVEIESKYRSAFFAVRVMSRGSNLINKDGFISTEDIINNKVKGRKISRHIIKSKIVPEYMPCVLDGKGLGAAGESTETLLTTEDFFREFYEKISAERECEVVLSTNFIDIISAGNLSGAESCYSMSVFRDKITDHGGTSSAPFAYAQDGQTLIAYVKHPKHPRYLSRVFVHIDSERDMFIVGRPYGNMSENMMLMIARVIEELLGTTPSQWKIRWDVEDYIAKCVGFKHRGASDLLYQYDNASLMLKRKYGNDKYFRLTMPSTIPCIRCGEDHNCNEGSGMCRSCVKEIEKMANSESGYDEFIVNPSFAGNLPTVELNSVVISPHRIENINII